MDIAINNLLSSAELCLERDLIKMARRALDTAIERLGGFGEIQHLEESLQQRILKLTELIGEPEQPLPSIPLNQRKVCDRCGGTKKHKSNKQCFKCHGKGFITKYDEEEDRLYWAYRNATERKKSRQSYLF